MEETASLVALRDQIVLLEGEILFEGWAADRSGRVRQPGLALLTNWRLIVTDIGGAFFAVPIAKFDRIDRPSPTEVRLTAWYEAISLRFESDAAAANFVNWLRQDPVCHAVIGLRTDPMASASREIVATRAPTSLGPKTASTDERLLMVEPSL